MTSNQCSERKLLAIISLNQQLHTTTNITNEMAFLTFKTHQLLNFASDHHSSRFINSKFGHNSNKNALPHRSKNHTNPFGIHQKILNRNQRSIITKSIKILATAAISPENALEEFLGWAVANGIEGLDGDKSKIGLFVGNHGERGIAATATLRRNESFAKIPLRLAITDDPEDEESNTLVGKDTLWSVRLACKLLRLKADGPASPWYPYLNSLPSSVPAPMINFSWEDVQSIAYEPARRQLDKTIHLVSSAWASLPPTAASSQLTREEFDWAISIVHSRTFGTAGKAGGVGVRMLVPLVDMLNHSGDQDLSSSTSAPVPTATDNVRWDLVSKIGGEFFMVLTATRDIKQGEELLLSYGERGNADFFEHYGFIPPRNIHDDVILFASIEDAIDWHLEKYIPLGKLPPNQLQEAISAAYTAAMREEGGAGGDGEELEAALAAMSEAEADHIREERSAIKLLSKGRTDGRFVAAIESLHGTARIAGNDDVAVNCQDHVREAVAARAVEVLRNMYTTAGMKLDEDLHVLSSSTATSGGGGGAADDEHGFRFLAEYYTAAISTSPYKDTIYNTTVKSSSLSDFTTAIIDAGGGLSGENAALLAALQAATPISSSSSSSSAKSTPFVDIDPTTTTDADTSTDAAVRAVHPLARQYRAYKAMILWDALLC
jgi:hypothetical protein